MAKLRRLGQIAEMMLRQRLSNKAQEDQQQRSFDQQNQVRLQGLTDKLSEAAQDPTKYDALNQIAQGLGVRLQAPVPTNLQRIAPIRGQIEAAKTQTDIPDEGDITTKLQTMYPSRKDLTAPIGGQVSDPGQDGNLDSTKVQPVRSPSIQDLMAARAKQQADIPARLAELTAQAGAMKKAESYGTASGTEQAAAEFGPAQLERKKTDFGAMSPLEATRAGLTAGATEDAKMTPARVGARVNEASRTAGGQESAKLTAEFDPKFVLARVNEYKQKAIAESAVINDRNAAKLALDGAAQASTASIALTQVKKLYDQVKLGGGALNAATRVQRTLTPTSIEQHINPQAAELDRLADGYAMQLYRAFGGTGQAVSDRDIAMMKGAVPYSDTIAQVGDKVFQNAATLLAFTPMIKARYGTQPFEKQMEVGQTWLQRVEQARQAGVDEFEDPFKPGSFVPVVK